MITALIAPVTGIIVSTSVGSAIGSAVQMIVPPATRALTGFGIKVGTAIVGGIIGSKIAEYAVENINSIITTVRETGTEETPIQETN